MFLCSIEVNSARDSRGLLQRWTAPCPDDRCDGRQSEAISPGISPGSDFKEPPNITCNGRRKQDVLYLCPQGAHSKELNRGSYL
jgi:hypothetical protein